MKKLHDKSRGLTIGYSFGLTSDLLLISIRSGGKAVEEFITEILNRIKIHLEKQSTDTISEPSKKNSSYYTSVDQFQRETDWVFKGAPLPLTFSSLVSEPNSWLTLEDYGIPLLLHRNSEGLISAFYNRCRHRGSKIAVGPQGKAECFSCPYHGWTYNQKGHLIGIPQQKNFDHLAPTQLSLIPFPVLESHGIIWGSVNSNSELLESSVAPLAKDPVLLQVNQAKFIESSEQTCSANWKVLVEGFLEGYHIQITHKKTFAAGVLSPISIQDILGNHSRAFYPLKKITKFMENPADSPEKTLSALSGVYHLFPNTILALEPYQISCLNFIPLSINTTRVRLTILSNEKTLQAPEKSLQERALLKAGVQEDLHIAEGIQANLNSNPPFDLNFGKTEGLITHFHQILDHWAG